MKKCKVSWCDTKVHANGFCGRHDMQIRRYNKILKHTEKDKNKIEILSDCAKIVIRNNKHKIVARAIIDKDNISKVEKYKWNINNLNYVVSKSFSKTTLLHRLLMGVNDKNVFIDHVNGNPLDNRLKNLRIATQSQNLANRNCVERIRKNSINTWQVYSKVNGKFKSFGNFNNLEDAKVARNKMEQEIFGEFAPLR